MNSRSETDATYLSEVLHRRRSIRRFQDRPVPENLIRTLLDVARWAPSGANRQPWHFVVVTDEGVRNDLASSAKAVFFDLNAHLRDAPVVIVACSDPRVSQWHLYDVSAAIMCLLLAVDSLGLGACWVGLFDEQRVKELLEIPAELSVAALIPIGYPAEDPTPTPRLEVDEITFWQRWGGRSPESASVPRTRFGRRGVPSVLARAFRNLAQTLLRRRH